jgi:hypothetical protein
MTVEETVMPDPLAAEHHTTRASARSPLAVLLAGGLVSTLLVSIAALAPEVPTDITGTGTAAALPLAGILAFMTLFGVMALRASMSRHADRGGEDGSIRPTQRDDSTRENVAHLLRAPLSYQTTTLRMAGAEQTQADHDSIGPPAFGSQSSVFERTRLDVLRRLALAAGRGDVDSAATVGRMALFAHQLALASGLDERGAKMIRDAAPLHDIGNIAIPEAILKKSSELDSGERAIVKRHAKIGSQILADSGSELLEIARTIALNHHERWDGTGYPSHLAGDQIPLAGRIVAIADVFNALTSPRPHRKPWAASEATSFIVQNSGRLFDPGLTSIFVREVPAIRRLMEHRIRNRDLHIAADGHQSRPPATNPSPLEQKS